MIKTIPPASPLLKQYIECFYLYTGEPSSRFRYLVFPHYNTGLSFFKGASVMRKQRCVEISAADYTTVKIEILGKYTYPLLIEYTGKLQEISIVFRPLGLNRFFRDNYHSIAPAFSQELVSKEWQTFGETLFTGENDIIKLESFLLAQLNEHPDFIRMEKVLSILSDPNNNTSISALAAQAGYTLKTFQRQFKKQMGCSPVEYRRICRFRHSINDRLNSTELKTLTDITYEWGYFDQSYFIKEFKKLTTYNPKEFFKAAGKVDGDKLVWELK